MRAAPSTSWPWCRAAAGRGSAGDRRRPGATWWSTCRGWARWSSTRPATSWRGCRRRADGRRRRRARAGRAGDRAGRAGQATVGGVVADGLAGPRRLRYGTPRDLLIGITIVRADGTVASSGGKVVKNVAGYDLGKLFAGSAGTLGADHRGDVPAAPAARRPGLGDRRVRVRPGRVRRGRGGGELAAGRLRGGAAPGGAGRSHPGRRAPRGVRPTGSRRARRGWRVCSAPAETSGASRRPGGRARPTPDGGTLIRVSFWVSALGRGADAVEAAAREAGVPPPIAGSAGRGRALPAHRLPTVAAGARRRRVRRGRSRSALPGRRGGRCRARRAACGTGALAGRGGMAGAVPGLALMRAVKDQFDPGHRMAPGRFPDAM